MAAGVYIHIPFCRSRCSYCDFATDVYRNDAAVERYVNALIAEIENFAPDSSGGARPEAPRVDTVYFGGGTPSLLAPRQLEKILAAVGRKFSVAAGAELTMEMNPATVTPESLAGYRSLGVNRASFGVQTFDDAALRRLARGHDAQDARDTLGLLRAADFDNVSFDLIAGLPRQTLADWRKNLDEALRLAPEHLSLYLLEVHEGTPLAEQIRSRRQPQPDEDLAGEMYELTAERTAAAGYGQYEISNFALPGRASRHNSKYWTLDAVFGFGVSAHSFDGAQTRRANERDTARYVRRIETCGAAEVFREEIDPASEFIFLGLRMTRGVNLADYERRFGVDLRERYAADLRRLGEDGLIEIGEDRLKLTARGALFSNEVFAAFV